jgi:Smg protein
MEELGRRRTDLVADVPDALQADARWGAPAPPLRVYASEEIDRLDAECRGFLMFLEQQGILDATRREVVLDRLMALELDDIDLIDLKWVVLMVLFNAPGQEAAYAWMESHLLESGGERVH